MTSPDVPTLSPSREREGNASSSLPLAGATAAVSPLPLAEGVGGGEVSLESLNDAGRPSPSPPEPAVHGLAPEFALSDRGVTPGTTLTVQPDADVRALDLTGVGTAEILYPKFRDGRGYSSAAILRERGFTGRVVAVGDLGVDQVVFLRRTGFDALRPDHAIDPAAAARALARYPAVYQAAEDGRSPVWAARHG